MRTIERAEVGTKKESREGNELTSLYTTRKTLAIIIRYTFLIAFLVLLASHEAANPKVGKTNIEFYSAEFSQGILSFEDAEDITEINLVKKFYLTRQNLPAWTTNFDINESFKELEELIGSAYYYGLLPSNYYYEQLQECKLVLENSDIEERKIEARICLEQTATRAALKFMSNLSMGINVEDTSAFINSFRNSLPVALNFHIKQQSLQEGILALQPENKQYTRLQKALVKYLYSAFEDTLVYLPEEFLGNDSLIADRLIQQGYLDKSFFNDSAAVHTAIRNFQQAHNLKLNGELDSKTLELLRLGTKEKFYRIALNLERIRKDRIDNSNHILVNIPEFQLYYYNKLGKEVNFNVVVGKKSSPTPLIQSQIELIVANPYWTVPQSITRNEMLPRIKKDSLYLKKHGFSVVDNYNKPIDESTIDWNQVKPNEFKYWLRQTNRNNALGVVKFLFPNEYSVYLHDTQSKRLFKRRVRAYSHGCVRVENPEELAQLIVEDDNAENKNIDIENLIKRKDKKEIKVADPLPIHIRYYTCTADSAGNISFHTDIYSKDELAIQELFANSSWN